MLTMSSVTLRKATVSRIDYESFNHVEFKCFGENYYSFYQYADVVSQGLTYFAENDNEVIGYIIAININHMVYTDYDEYEIIQTILKNKKKCCFESCFESLIRFNTQKRYLHIFGFGVLPEHRGKGIGNSLMNEILCHQKKEKLPVILEVRISNVGAIRLYKKFGFETATTIPDYYEDNHEPCYLLIRPQ